jgi:hypothetical protein
MRRQLGTLAISIATMLVLVASASRAWAADDALAILGIDSLDVGEALGTQLTEALRHRAAETPGVRLLPGKDLIEMKMVFGCDGEAPACLAQAGRSLGADRLLYGSIKRTDGGRGIVIALKLLDVRELAVVKTFAETLPKKGLTQATVAAAAARGFAQLVVPPQTGGIAVASQPSDAQVTLDGNPVGRTPLKLKDLHPRSYTVGVQIDGYEPQTKVIDVTAGGNETWNARLTLKPRLEPPPVGLVSPPPEIVPPPVEEPRRVRHPGRPLMYTALGLASGAVVAGAVAIYTWRQYLSFEDSAHNNLYALKPQAGTAAQRIFYGKPTCTTPPGVMASDPHAQAYLSNCRSGGNYAAATTGLWVSAGVLATAGIVSFVIGQTLENKATKAEQERRGLRQSLRLLPAVSTQGGGLSASFEF